MKKDFLFVLIFTISSITNAGWTITSSLNESGKTDIQIQQLKLKYERDLKYLSPADWYYMEQLSVTVDTWEWNGPSSCNPGSPSLKLKDISYSYGVRGPFGYFGELVWGDFETSPPAPPCK